MLGPGAATRGAGASALRAMPGSAAAAPGGGTGSAVPAGRATGVSKVRAAAAAALEELLQAWAGVPAAAELLASFVTSCWARSSPLGSVGGALPFVGAAVQSGPTASAACWPARGAFMRVDSKVPPVCAFLLPRGDGALADVADGAACVRERQCVPGCRRACIPAMSHGRCQCLCYILSISRCLIGSVLTTLRRTTRVAADFDTLLLASLAVAASFFL